MLKQTKKNPDLPYQHCVLEQSLLSINFEAFGVNEKTWKKQLKNSDKLTCLFWFLRFTILNKKSAFSKKKVKKAWETDKLDKK